jgi:hypothetical protein
LDLCLKIEDKLYVIIELMYCTYKKEFTKNEENKILANAAFSILKPKEFNQIFINTLREKLSVKEWKKILLKASNKIELSKDEENKILLKEALNTLKEEEINIALANTIRIKLPVEEVEKIIKKNISTSNMSEKQIDSNLSTVLEQSLLDIKKRDYHSTIKDKNSKILDLGLAIFGSGEKIKAKFAP